MHAPHRDLAIRVLLDVGDDGLLSNEVPYRYSMKPPTFLTDHCAPSLSLDHNPLLLLGGNQVLPGLASAELRAAARRLRKAGRATVLERLVEGAAVATERRRLEDVVAFGTAAQVNWAPKPS